MGATQPAEEKGHEVFVKVITYHFHIPKELAQMRRHYLQVLRKSQGYPSWLAAESDLILQAANYARALFKGLPHESHVYERYTPMGIRERAVYLNMLESKVRQLINMQLLLDRANLSSTEDIYVRLAERAATVITELAGGYKLPKSFVYVVLLAKGLILQPGLLLEQDRLFLTGLLETIEEIVKEAKATLARLDDITGLPPYLRVAVFLEPDRLYTIDAIAVLASTAGVIHAGQPETTRQKLLADIVDMLVTKGYLKQVAGGRGRTKYLCLKRFGDEEE